jgi:hypothetical protein
MGITYYSGVRRLPQLIVVGILNTDRTRDMTPRKVIQRENSGGGDAFLEFIGSELIPYIDGKYRTVPYRVLSGGSSAGMFTLYTLFSRPESFHAYIASRPALNSHAGYTWDADVISRRAVSFFREIPSGKISLFIDHGGQEDVLHNPEPIHKLSGLFKRDSQESFYWEIQRTGESGYRSAESLINGLLSVFDSWYYPADSLYTRGFSGIRKHAESLSERLAYPVTAADLLTENDLLRFGYRFLENNNIKEAINIFEYAVSVYFNSWNAFDGLAEAYKKAD